MKASVAAIEAFCGSRDIHSGPKTGAWTHILERGPEDSLIIAAIPEFSLKLGRFNGLRPPADCGGG
jgi:hypothetical protein